MNAARLASLRATRRLFRPDPPSGDLNMNGVIDVLGDVLMYRGHINETCT
jgi:hypothetical protein